MKKVFVFLFFVLIFGICFADDYNLPDLNSPYAFEGNASETINQELILGIIVVGLVLVAIVIAGILVYAHGHKEDIEVEAARKLRIEDYVGDDDNRRLDKRKQEKIETEVMRRLKADRDFRKGSSFAAPNSKKVFAVSVAEAEAKAKEEVKREILEKLRKDLEASKREQVAKEQTITGLKVATAQTEVDVAEQTTNIKRAASDVIKDIGYKPIEKKKDKE